MKPSTLVQKDGKTIDTSNGLEYGSAAWQESILDAAMTKAETNAQAAKKIATA